VTTRQDPADVFAGPDEDAIEGLGSRPRRMSTSITKYFSSVNGSKPAFAVLLPEALTDR
jgi:hypothetical protein